MSTSLASAAVVFAGLPCRLVDERERTLQVFVAAACELLERPSRSPIPDFQSLQGRCCACNCFESGAQVLSLCRLGCPVVVP